MLVPCAIMTPSLEGQFGDPKKETSSTGQEKKSRRGFLIATVAVVGGVVAYTTGAIDEVRKLWENAGVMDPADMRRLSVINCYKTTFVEDDEMKVDPRNRLSRCGIFWSMYNDGNFSTREISREHATSKTIQIAHEALRAARHDGSYGDMWRIIEAAMVCAEHSEITMEQMGMSPDVMREIIHIGAERCKKNNDQRSYDENMRLLGHLNLR